LGLALRFAYGTKPETFAAGGQDETKTDSQPRSTYRRLGEILLDEEMISPESFEAAVKQYSSTEPRHLGEYLVQQQLITAEQLKLALELQGTQPCSEEQPIEEAESSIADR